MGRRQIDGDTPAQPLVVQIAHCGLSLKKLILVDAQENNHVPPRTAIIKNTQLANSKAGFFRLYHEVIQIDPISITVEWGLFNFLEKLREVFVWEIVTKHFTTFHKGSYQLILWPYCDQSKTGYDAIVVTRCF